MNIDDTLDKMNAILDKAVTIPLSGQKRLVDVQSIENLIDEIRLNLPGEIQNAKEIVANRKAIVADAKKEAETIINRAQSKAAELISQQEISKQAQLKANQIMTKAQADSKTLRVSTNDYVDGMLSRIEELLTNDLTDVKKAKNALKNTTK